ncbi:MAG: ankyrin repeat domain-containing protein [Deinococcota bacterium]
MVFLQGGLAQDELADIFAFGSLREVQAWLDTTDNVDTEISINFRKGSNYLLPDYPFYTNNLRTTPLALAAMFNQDIDVVRLLLDYGADPNFKDDEHSTPFMRALAYGKLDAAELLRQAGADPATYNFGLLIKGEQVEAVKYLIELGAESTTQQLVAAAEHEEIFWLLVNAGATLDATWATEALWSADTAEVTRYLISLGANIDARHEYPNNATVLAASTCPPEPEVVQTLIEAGADVNAANNGDFTALMQASYCNEPWHNHPYPYPYEQETLEVASLLLAADADVNATTSRLRNSALHYAVRYGFADLVNLLIDSGADIEAKASDGIRTPIFDTAYSTFCTENKETLRALLEAGVDVNAQYHNGITPLMQWGDPEGIRLLLEFGADPEIQDRFGHTAIIYMLETDRCGGFASGAYFVLKEAGADLTVRTQYGKTLLMLAAESPDGYEVVEDLLNAGLDVNAENDSGFSALSYAATPEIAQLLLDAGADIEKYGGNAILHATHQLDRRDDIEVRDSLKQRIYLLLEAGADIDYQDGFLLAEAVKMRDIQLTEYLLDRGANLNLSDERGLTPLLWSGYDHPHNIGDEVLPEIIELLVSWGADVNSQIEITRTGRRYVLDEFLGDTPLIQAARRDSLETVKLLIEAGADVSITNANGDTPLIQAAHFGNLATVQLIVEAGADVSVKNTEGFSAIRTAARLGHTDIKNYLLNVQAIENRGLLSN